MLEEHEPPARSEDSLDLPERAPHVLDRAEHQRAHNGIHALIPDIQPFARPAADIDLQTDPSCLLSEIRVHEQVRLDPDPVYAIAIVAKIHTRPGSDLQDVAF